MPAGSLTPQEQRELANIHSGLVNGPNSMRALGCEMLRLQQMIAQNPDAPEADQHRKALKQVHEKWTQKHDKLMEDIKRKMDNSGSLLDQMMASLAGSLSKWKQGINRGLLDYLWDPKGTYYIRSLHQQQRHEHFAQKRKNFANTTLGAAVYGVGTVVSAIPKGLGYAGSALGGVADYVGRGLRSLGDEQLRQANSYGGNNRVVASYAAQGGQYLAAGAAYAAGGVMHGLGLVSKAASTSVRGLGYAGQAVTDYAVGRQDRLTAETYGGAVSRVADWLVQEGGEAVRGLSRGQADQGPNQRNEGQQRNSI